MSIAGCCWWGRGAIQTTGPNNYGLLNQEVVQKIDKYVDEGFDLCTACYRSTGRCNEHQERHGRLHAMALVTARSAPVEPRQLSIGSQTRRHKTRHPIIGGGVCGAIRLRWCRGHVKFPFV